jgi:hypothetical protein
MFCTQCGGRNPDGASYCAQCGQRLSSQPATPIKTGANQPTVTHTGKRKSIGLAILLIVLFGPLGYFYYSTKWYAWTNLAWFILFVVLASNNSNWSSALPWFLGVEYLMMIITAAVGINIDNTNMS